MADRNKQQKEKAEEEQELAPQQAAREAVKAEEEQELAPQQAAREAVKAADPPPDEPKFPVERLVSQSAALTGYLPHEVAGALSGVQNKTLTVEEAKAATKAWLDSPVKED